jgi:hypothetical protein
LIYISKKRKPFFRTFSIAPKIRLFADSKGRVGMIKKALQFGGLFNS